MPRVSVVMPSYNHARFIDGAIRSVLDQTMGDLELIIVDDYSLDGSNEIIAVNPDWRLRHIPLDRNAGACEAMNIAIRHASAPFIAVCNSDDLWEPDKLRLQLELIEQLPDVGAVFSDVLWIDDDDTVLSGLTLPHFASVFRQPNRSRYGWMRHLIENGNCLCHPSVLIRRQVYEDIGLYNNLLRQLPDLDMWLRVVQRYEIHVMPDRLVRFRIHANNTSRETEESKRRTRAEHVLIDKLFFEEISAANFYKAFGHSTIGVPDFADSLTLLREKIAYLTTTSCAFSYLFKEIATEMAYRGTHINGQEVVPALEFQALTASTSQIGFPNFAPFHHKRSPLKQVWAVELHDWLRGIIRKRNK